jgi:hypothetical protein
VLGGIILIKATTMGFALLAMTWFAVRAGQPIGARADDRVWADGARQPRHVDLVSSGEGRAADRAIRAPRRLAPRSSFSRHHRRGVAGTGLAPDAGARGGDPAGHAARQPARRIRYLPALFGSKEAARRAQLELDRPFIAGVTSGKGQVFLDRAPDEIVVGTVGKLHQIRDQEFAEVPTTADFATFAQPNHERLAMSIRAIPGDHATLLALEHRTQPTDAAARRRFARYWLAIRPGGAFVTRQLLKAVARRAERGTAATGSAIHLSN